MKVKTRSFKSFDEAYDFVVNLSINELLLEGSLSGVKYDIFYNEIKMTYEVRYPVKEED